MCWKKVKFFLTKNNKKDNQDKEYEESERKIWRPYNPWLLP